MKRRRDCQHFHFGPFGKKIIFMFSCFMSQKKLFLFFGLLQRRHDTWHNDTMHNDTRHNIRNELLRADVAVKLTKLGAK